MALRAVTDVLWLEDVTWSPLLASGAVDEELGWFATQREESRKFLVRSAACEREDVVFCSPCPPYVFVITDLPASVQPCACGTAAARACLSGAREKASSADLIL